MARLILPVQLDFALIQKLLDSYGKNIHTLEETQIQLGSCRTQLRHLEYQFPVTCKKCGTEVNVTA